jgi:hypothetical protein
MELTSVKNTDTLVTKDSVVIKNGDSIVWRLYSSTKIISKDGFWAADKEMIGVGSMLWIDVKDNGFF